MGRKRVHDILRDSNYVAFVERLTALSGAEKPAATR